MATSKVLPMGLHLEMEMVSDWGLHWVLALGTVMAHRMVHLMAPVRETVLELQMANMRALGLARVTALNLALEMALVKVAR